MSIQKEINEIIRERFPLEPFKEQAIFNQRVKNTPEGFCCPKCRSDNVYEEVKQTRSADEDPTHFYFCLNCNFRWRMG